MIETPRTEELPWALPHPHRERLLVRIGHAIDTLAAVRRAFTNRTTPVRIRKSDGISE